MTTSYLESVASKQFTIFVFILIFQEKCFSLRPSVLITPRNACLDRGETLTVMCMSDRQLHGCQFHLRDEDVMDFSGGVGTSMPGNHSTYFGAGLRAGECGMRMRRTDLIGMYVVGCRVRAETGGWVYADMTLYVNSAITSRPNPFDMVESYHDTVVVLLGERLNVEYSLKSPISDPSANCTFDVPGVESLDDPRESQGKIFHFLRFGHSVSQCGVEIQHVQEVNSGWLFGHLKTSSFRSSSPLPKISIIVAKSPEAFDMEVKSRDGVTSFEEGDTLTAICEANFSRPVPNITWHFGDDVIRQDSDDDSPISSEWFWDYEEQSIMQNISRKLSWQDDGKTLICQMTHLALDDEDGDNVSVVIHVEHSRSNVVPTHFSLEDLVVGHAATIVVDTDRWNIVRPTFLWRVRNVTIREDEVDQDYRIRARRAFLENDKWIASLHIYSVRMDDMAQPMLLIAGDDNERREFLVTVTAVDLKLQYTLVTLLCGLMAILVVLSVIYYKDLHHWFTGPMRFRQGRTFYNTERIMYSSDGRTAEQMF